MQFTADAVRELQTSFHASNYRQNRFGRKIPDGEYPVPNNTVELTSERKITVSDDVGNKAMVIPSCAKEELIGLATVGRKSCNEVIPSIKLVATCPDCYQECDATLLFCPRCQLVYLRSRKFQT